MELTTDDHDEVIAALRSQVAHLELALVNRDTIGQAKGILMATFRILADQAFAMLVAASQSAGVKLHVVAQMVVDTGASSPVRVSTSGTRAVSSRTDAEATASGQHDG